MKTGIKEVDEILARKELWKDAIYKDEEIWNALIVLAHLCAEQRKALKEFKESVTPNVQ